MKSFLVRNCEICILVKDLRIHMLAINETKLDVTIDDDLVGIEG